MYNEFVKIKTNYISHANIYSTRNFGSIFFCAFFGGAAKSPHVTLSEGEESSRVRASSSRTLFVAFRRCLNDKQFAE